MVNSEKKSRRYGPRVQKMARLVLLLIAVLPIQLAVGSPARADVTYLFTTPEFSTSYVPSQYTNIYGYVTFYASALADGEAGATVGPSGISSWQLSSGPTSAPATVSSSSGVIYSACSFTFDSSGDLTSWDFGVAAALSSAPPDMSIDYNPSNPYPQEYDYLYLGGNIDWAAYGGSEGTVWTIVPAPAGILLFGTGLLGLAAARLRKRWRK